MKIKGKLEDGTIKEYDVVLTCQNPNNNKNYVIYTDNTYDDEGKLKMYSAQYDEDGFIGEPATKEEYEELYKVLDSVFIGKE